MEVIITAATVASAFFNLSTSSSTSSLYYDTKTDSNKVVAVNVYDESDGLLYNKNQYSFEYDQQNRLVRKIVKSWDSCSREYVNTCEYEYSYNASGYNIVHKYWDEKKHAFDDADGMTSYDVIGSNVLAVNTYKWQDNTKKFVRVNAMLVMDPHLDLFYAQIK